MSDISSAGSNGKTCRQDVLRGVDVPVAPGTAGRALPRPGAQGQVCEDATRARVNHGLPERIEHLAAIAALAAMLRDTADPPTEASVMRGTQRHSPAEA